MASKYPTSSTGFCGETEEEHADTLSLMEAVGYDMAYMFAYSMRERTHAHRNYVDDVPENVKQRRLSELIRVFRESTRRCYDAQVGTTQLVLVEGPNKRSPEDELTGKSDRGHKVSFPRAPLQHCSEDSEMKIPVPGDFVEVRITKSNQASLSGEASRRTSLGEFYRRIRSSDSNGESEFAAEVKSIRIHQ